MNIVFAYPTGLNPQKGGVERITDIIAKILLKRGYTIFYLNWKSNFLNYNSYIVRQFLIYGQGIISL